jgi:hypothetical protein
VSRVRKALVVLASGVLAATLSAGPALAGPRPRVGPHQVFDGYVNHGRGIRGPVTIAVNCVGPIVPGETGTAAPGQSVEIRLAVHARHASGNTGDSAFEIDAFFGAPPPDGDTRPMKGDVRFTKYGLAKAIPQNIEFPCSGTGQVTFVPFLRAPPTSKPATVPVVYVGQP